MGELDKLVYKNITIKDFDEKFDKLKTVSEKFDFLTNYILSYGLGHDTRDPKNDVEENFSIIELIAHARFKFIEASLDARTDYEKKNNVKLPKNVIDPLDKNYKKYAAQKKFITESLEYIKDVSENRKMTLNADKKNPEYDKVAFYKMNLSRNLIYIKVFDDFDDYCNDYVIKDFSNKVGNVVYKNQDLDYKNLLNINKGGFFERFFRTTSEQYQTFEATFKVFNDPNSQAYGDLDNLKGAARAYLRYKIPSFTDKYKFPRKEDIERFSGTTRRRVELCVGILKTIEREKNIVDAVIDLSKEDNQNEFYNDLNNNTDEANKFNKIEEYFAESDLSISSDLNNSEMDANK